MTEDKSCDSCEAGGCTARDRKQGESPDEFDERREMMKSLCRIEHKIIVLSGKGGVGKTTVAANLGVALAGKGRRTGVMDVDIHGPSIPRILGIEGSPVRVRDEKLLPVPVSDNLVAMSIGILMQGQEDAVIWRGPLKMGMIKQFLRDVEWGDLDYLVIDCPPGTGDEPLSVIQLVDKLDGAVVVTTPQDLAVADVRRSINFCRTVNVPVLGVIENMSGFVCPHCGKVTDIFKTGGGEQMAKDMKVPFLGRIPLEPAIAESSDQGKPYLSVFGQSESAKSFAGLVKGILDKVEAQG